jgi:hypothetical protein
MWLAGPIHVAKASNAILVSCQQRERRRDSVGSAAGSSAAVSVVSDQVAQAERKELLVACAKAGKIDPQRHVVEHALAKR